MVAVGISAVKPKNEWRDDEKKGVRFCFLNDVSRRVNSALETIRHPTRRSSKRYSQVNAKNNIRGSREDGFILSKGLLVAGCVLCDSSRRLVGVETAVEPCHKITNHKQKTRSVRILVGVACDCELWDVSLRFDVSRGEAEEPAP